MTVRAAVEGDAEAIREVGAATWPATYEPIAGPRYVELGLAKWWSLDTVRAGVERGGVFVAERDGAVVGMASVGERDGEPYLWKLYVVPHLHGAGAGSELLTAVLDAVPPGSARLGLDYVDGNERAASFYRAKGFREVGRKPSALGFGPDEILMELPLHPSAELTTPGSPRRMPADPARRT
jgi:GNAT superfamily N-acetyltransferase